MMKIIRETIILEVFMGRVLIIKNGNSDARINDYARKSFEQSKKYYYNSVDGTYNEQALIDLKK